MEVRYVSLSVNLLIEQLFCESQDGPPEQVVSVPAHLHGKLVHQQRCLEGLLVIKCMIGGTCECVCVACECVGGVLFVWVCVEGVCDCVEGVCVCVCVCVVGVTHRCSVSIEFIVLVQDLLSVCVKKPSYNVSTSHVLNTHTPHTPHTLTFHHFTFSFSTGAFSCVFGKSPTRDSLQHMNLFILNSRLTCITTKM